MIINNDKKYITKLNDKRVTKIGRILRSLKIDEIPQLLNIVKGDMRFIGPRPEVPKYVNKEDFSFLNHIKPGLSDFSSIIFRKEDHILSKIKHETAYESILLPIKIRLGHIYSKNKSFRLDLILTICTIVSTFLPNIINNFLINFYIKHYDSLIIKDIKLFLIK